MSAAFYLGLHFVSIFALISALTVVLLGETRSKAANITLGVSSLGVLIAGFGLIAKLGYSLQSTWIIGKILIWLAVAFLGPYVAKRYPTYKKATFLLLMSLLIVAVLFVIIKP